MTKKELQNILKKEGSFYSWKNTLECEIKRNRHGSWCGYVTIPKSFAIDFDDDLPINCHGGITFQNLDKNGDLKIGFDCAHFNDLIPDIHFNILKPDVQLDGLIYRDKDFVISEVNDMVTQILNIVTVQRQIKIDQILE
jgi:hypothetical protein